MSARIGIVVIAVVFAVLHAWALFQGIANLIALPGVYERLGIADLTPWWLLIVGVAAPPLAFAGALLLGRGTDGRGTDGRGTDGRGTDGRGRDGRGRILSHRVVLLAVSLATVNAIVLSSGALAPILLAFAAG